MKNSYLLNFVLVGMLLITMGSCKKLSPAAKSVTKTTVDTALNPIQDQPVCDYNYDESTLTNNGYTKVFEDNFDGDLSKWNVWTGGDGNGELQYYQAPNMTLSNGILQINAKPQNITGPTTIYDNTPKAFSFTSGRLDSKTSFSAGTATPKVRIIARIKFSGSYGMSNAFWMLGDATWPTAGEIDIARLRGDDNTRYFSQYFYGNTAGQNLVQGSYMINHSASNTKMSDCFHVYEMEWSQSALTSYLDGKLIEVKTAGGHVPDLFNKSEHIVLNLAVGGKVYNAVNTGLVTGGTMQVDYVKVFTSK